LEQTYYLLSLRSLLKKEFGRCALRSAEEMPEPSLSTSGWDTECSPKSENIMQMERMLWCSRDALNAIDQLRHGKTTVRDAIIWRSFRKPIEEYRVDAPHVQVAKEYLKLGGKLVPGDKIGYVITKKGTKLNDKARPYSEITSDEVDTEYYVSGQVASAAARILEIFGIS
jgi:hypothetical protein